MKKLVLAALVFVPAASVAAPAPSSRQAIRLDALLVTASPVETRTSEAMRSVQVIERADIARSPAATLAELLAQQPGLSIQRRGAPGVQADLGIRGSSFEQTLVLIDGVPIQNPQTGHHNLDLPVPLAHIERIEIVKGPGAIQYGGSATGGIVNLITRQPSGLEGSLDLAAGSRATRQFDARIAHAGRRGHHGLSVSTLDTDGDPQSGPSDARVRQAFYTGGRNGDASRIFWGAGALEKDFGAWGFYSAEYPDARERTEGRLAWLGAEGQAGAWRLRARAHFDRHEDGFLTRIGGRDYINEHLTRVAGLQADAQREDAGGTTAMGAQLRHERLASNALRDHERDVSAIWLLRQQRLGRDTRAEASISRADHEGQRARWLPALALSHAFGPGWRGFAAAARSSRAPSYTELYLATAANRGNAALVPEVSDHAELGLEGRTAAQTLTLALHQRRTRDLIDWTRAPGTATWVANNLDGHRGRGFEAGWRWTPTSIRWLARAGLGYEYLHARVDDAAREVKYAPRVARHTWRADARLDLGAGFGLDLDLRRPRYVDETTATLANARLGWQGKTLRAHVSIQNLLDREIIETGFAPIPGRWLSLGFGAQWE
jgi:iron complex outermembrane receptor protein